MPDYPYRCDGCGYAGDFHYRMGEAPKDLPCPLCEGGTLRRSYEPVSDLWKNANGDLVRAPGRAWAGGETFDPVEFRAKNRINTERGRRGAR